MVVVVVQNQEIRPEIEAIPKYVQENPVREHLGHGRVFVFFFRFLFQNWMILSSTNTSFVCSSEEIPLEDFRQSRTSSPSSRCSSRATSRSHTPSRLVVETLSVAPQESQLSVAGNVAAELDSNSAHSNSKETSFIAHKKKGTVETVWRMDDGGRQWRHWDNFTKSRNRFLFLRRSFCFRNGRRPKTENSKNVNLPIATLESDEWTIIIYFSERFGDQ